MISGEIPCAEGGSTGIVATLVVGPGRRADCLIYRQMYIFYAHPFGAPGCSASGA